MLRSLLLTVFLITANILRADFCDFTEDEDGLIQADGIYDLERVYSPFILETKRIDLPEYPGAFNPSIVRWQGKLLMSFRIRNQDLVHEVGMVWVDEEMNPISSPARLQMEASSEFSKLQDPRLIAIKDRLHVVYSDRIPLDNGKEKRRVFIGDIEFEGNQFTLKNARPFNSFEGEDEKRIEKNWTPFAFEDELLLSYIPSPHRILRPYPEEGRCETVCQTNREFAWNLGELRGGTPSIWLEKEGCYLSFFHSSKKVASIQSDKKVLTHYFMGAYTFEDHPPFAIKAISESPIFGENFYTKTAFKTWKFLKVVFPCGLIESADHLWVLYGKQDSELWAAKIVTQGLLDSLGPVD